MVESRPAELHRRRAIGLYAVPRRARPHAVGDQLAASDAGTAQARRCVAARHVAGMGARRGDANENSGRQSATAVRLLTQLKRTEAGDMVARFWGPLLGSALGVRFPTIW